MANFKDAAAALEFEETVSVLTRGTSMRPMLREHRDLVVIEKLKGVPRVNDVLLYRKKGFEELVLHRLIKIKNGRYVFRGDNNYFTEYDVTDEDIVGILKEFYRDGKYCSCQNKKYRLYSFYIMHSYGARYLWKRIIRPFLSKIKHKIIK